MAKTFDFLGAKELQEAFLNIPAYVNSGVIDKELIEAGKPLIKRAKEIASNADNTRNLTKSIGAISDRKLASEPAAIVMGPRRGRGHKGHHAHLVEYGTGPRKLLKPIRVKVRGVWQTVTQTGTMPAFPFMRPAYDQKAQEVADNVKRLYSKLITKGAGGALK
jgi:hypothetical protein